MQSILILHSKIGASYTQLNISSNCGCEAPYSITKSLLRCFLNNLLIILTSFLIEHNLFGLNSSEVIQSILPDVLRLLALTSKRKSVEDCLSATTISLSKFFSSFKRNFDNFYLFYLHNLIFCCIFAFNN